MSVETLALVLHHARAKGTDKVILIGIANHDGDGGAWPSVGTLARYANVTERNVQAALKRLEKAGEVAIHVQGGGPSGLPAHRRPNRYEVLVACPLACDRTSRHRVKDLPKAPADLCITGVSPTTPGVAHDTGGVSPATGEGVSPATPEPYLEPNNNPALDSESELQTARDLANRSALVRCSVCDHERHVCEARTQVSGHEFTPRPLRSVPPPCACPTAEPTPSMRARGFRVWVNHTAECSSRLRSGDQDSKALETMSGERAGDDR